MSAKRPCRYQVGDRVIYGGAEGCAAYYEGYGATVVSVGDYLYRSDTYILHICFDAEAHCNNPKFSTLEYRVQPLCAPVDLFVDQFL